MTWLDQAGCAGDLRFTERPQEHQDAICRVCTVRADCRSYGTELWRQTGDGAAREGLLESPARFGGVGFTDLAETSR